MVNNWNEADRIVFFVIINFISKRPKSTTATATETELTGLSLAHNKTKRAQDNVKLVCYYSNWAVYRPGVAKFTPQNINPFLCVRRIELRT